ncbi:hypothetical protein DB30_06656 [Enhygromyxa salina]|uniref:SET domain-containing protein n=1 Tax=Enhygromyxa salina TaxID=215803 RepID=A0A0C2CTV8_9BACT|nr:SET domain-containing protein [Enhygromyxa salina]KIG14601.1 hypothetical protein DB30_06656 [Enhygromyxa salina]
MIHPQTKVSFISELVSDGVLARADIPRGTIVWTQDVLDQVFEQAAFDRFPPAVQAQLDRYAHRDALGRYVLCWDAGRYVNHHCDPALRGVGSWFMVARRDIEAGEEITCDYAECNLDEALMCDCADPACRGQIHGRDLLRYAGPWDAEARELAGLIRTVPQPLWPYLLDPAQAGALRDGQQDPISFRDQCAYKGGK